MRHLIPFAVLLLFAFVTACQQENDPQPQLLTRTDSLKAMLSGTWQSTQIVSNRYTNDVFQNQEQRESIETYNFGKAGDFQLKQGDFAIKGDWTLNRSGNELNVTTPSGELLQWQVAELSEERLILFSSQTTIVSEQAHRLETTVVCDKIKF
jgi:hypothetical protein